jgi:hypothetical protein
MSACKSTTERVRRAKTAYSVRRVPLDQPLTVLDVTSVRPKHGDLVLATVARLGQHGKLELRSSRRATLYVGDEIVVAYGARYAPDQFEAELPTDLGPCELVAAGGMASRVTSKHTGMNPATALEPVGILAASDGAALSVGDGALAVPPTPTRRTPTVVIAGTAMNAGKTTTAAAIIHGLTRAGLRVGACKITGTAAGGDPNLYRDAGAAEVLDFTDDGLVGTYRVPVARLAATASRLHAHLVGRGADAIVVEIADGVLQAETAALLASAEMRRITDAVVFAAGDAAGALQGVAHVRAADLPVIALSGLLTASPLAVREAQARLDLPVYSMGDLSDPTLACSLLDRVGAAAELASRVAV